MTDMDKPLIALYNVLVWKNEGTNSLVDWQKGMAQLEVLTKQEEKKLYQFLLHVAFSIKHNAEPIQKFLDFFMHPPRYAPTPTRKFIWGFNDTLAAYADKHTGSLCDLTGRLDQTHLQFMMMNVSTTAQTVLCKQPNLLLYCEPKQTKPTLSVNDMYRVSVNRNYDKLATMFHWLLEGFPGSFQGSLVDDIQLETTEEEAARQAAYDTQVREIQDNTTFPGTTVSEKLTRFVENYCRRPH
jgi:hypothetical protein